MAKKQTKKANGLPLAAVIRNSANQIWLAGLGALAQAEEKGGDWFDSLTAAGEKLEKAAREQITRPIRVAEQRVTKTRDSFEESWEAIALVFERRLAKLLNSFQIPTRRDIAELTRRVEELQALVNTLEQGAPSKKASPARRATRASGARKTKPARKKAAGRARSAGRASTRASARSSRKDSASRQSRTGA